MTKQQRLWLWCPVDSPERLRVFIENHLEVNKFSSPPTLGWISSLFELSPKGFCPVWGKTPMTSKKILGRTSARSHLGIPWPVPGDFILLPLFLFHQEGLLSEGIAKFLPSCANVK